MTSPAAEADPNPLITLFRQCVVRITDGEGRFRGSGFLVAPGQVLSCGHVVHGAKGLRVHWQEQATDVAEVAAAPPLESVSDPHSYPLPDLAVLGLNSDAQAWGHPCAALAGQQPVLGGAVNGLYLAGYTVEHSREPSLTGATTEFESLVTEDGHAFFKLKRGLVLPGFSGSPLLDRQAGLVTGIVESTRSRQADLGGFAVPAAEFVIAFPRVADANQAFHARDGRWAAAAEAETVRSAERDGTRGRLAALRPPLVALPSEDEDVSAATVLRPRHAVVGYVGREQLLADIAAWCEREAGSAVQMWFVTGGGGFGKTRLAVEACREAEARGWTAGLLNPAAGGARLEALAQWPGRLLIAVDYAETLPGLVGQLAEEITARAPRAPVRVLLLVRRRASRADLLGLFNDQHEEQLDVLLRRAPVSRLDENESEVDRLELFRQAVDDFSRLPGAPPAEQASRPRLQAAHFDRPLYVLTAAYLARVGTDVDALGEAGLLRTLLAEHEAGHWDRWDERRHLGLDRADQRAAVAVATLLTAAGEAEALTVARLIPHFAAEPESRLIAITRWLADLYPPPAASSPSSAGNSPLIIAPLEPDRFGEVLTGDVLREHPDLLGAALDAATDRQLAQALTVAGRTARDDQTIRNQLRTALDERLGDLLQRGLAAEADELLTAVVSAMTISRPTRGALQAADRFPKVLPVWLRPLAADITSLAVEGLHARAEGDMDAVPDLARQLSDLGVRLSDAGRRDEALMAAQEAVTIRRDLAQANPAAYLPDLTASLSNLGNRLSAAGRRDEALMAEQEAVTIRRDLAQANPAAYLPDLTASLSNLGVHLSAAGRRDEALMAAQEAVTIRRDLAQANPAAYLPDLAASLSNLGAHLSAAGRRDEALMAAQEAVTIRRDLAQANPAAYLPDLAASLSNLGVHLSDAGRRDEALMAAQEAVIHYRDLAQANPAAYLPDLATSLSNLGNRLSETGRRDEALTAEQEAVTIRRDLAQANPAAYLPDLATSLSNLGVRLSETGRRDEALMATQEAVIHYRDLAQANPAAYLPDLATSLSNLGADLSVAGRRDEALMAAQEAVTIRRDLAQANLAAYLPDLAASLSNLGVHLSAAGRRDEALMATQEAVTHYRDLAQANPAAYLPDLATSLSNLGIRLSETGRRDEALTAEQEAVTHYRDLAQANPAAYLPDLATSLSNLGNRLSETGRRDEALTAEQEAVTIRRDLAQANPAAYLPDLATSLSNLGNRLSDAGRHAEAEELLSGTLGAFSHTPLGVGHIRLVRGRWLLTQNRRTDALTDLHAAVAAFAEARDYLMRGRTRQDLCALRQADPAAFDHAWEQVLGALPVWLQHPAADEQLASSIIDWIRTPDWTASQAYLDTNAAALLTDEAEATLEHLIDYNPGSADLHEHLTLLQAARTHGTAAAYTSHLEQLQTQRLLQALSDWITPRTWADSRAYATAHAAELLHPAALNILDTISAQDPGDMLLRLHRGLLAYATSAGFDAAYDLLADPAGQQRILTDPATPPGTCIAVARLHSGQAPDDPEAHFQLTTAALLATLDAASPQAADQLAREATAVLTDCATNAAPYERRDFTRRLTQLTTDHPDLASNITELQPILDNSA